MGPSWTVVWLFLSVWSSSCIGGKYLLHFGPLCGLLENTYISWSPSRTPFALTLLFIGLFLCLLGSILPFSFCITIEMYHLDYGIQMSHAVGPLKPSGTTCAQNWACPDIPYTPKYWKIIFCYTRKCSLYNCTEQCSALPNSLFGKVNLSFQYWPHSTGPYPKLMDTKDSWREKEDNPECRPSKPLKTLHFWWRERKPSNTDAGATDLSCMYRRNVHFELIKWKGYS